MVSKQNLRRVLLSGEFCIRELATKLPSIYTITACARIIIEAGQTSERSSVPTPNLSWEHLPASDGPSVTTLRFSAIAFALAVATSAQAMSPVPLHQQDGMITQVREACGAGMDILMVSA